MLVMTYAHRLPADHDMSRVRARVAARAPAWDAAPGLGFKAFAVRERGRHGAGANLYASFYLWLEPAAARDFLTDARFASVADTFGRPAVETWLPLDVAAGAAGAAGTAGAAGHAGTLTREAVEIDPEADLARLRAAEAERNRAALARPGVLAAVSGLDTAAWRCVRLTLAAGPPEASAAGTAYQVLHLAAPGWAALSGEGR